MKSVWFGGSCCCVGLLSGKHGAKSKANTINGYSVAVDGGIESIFAGFSYFGIHSDGERVEAHLSTLKLSYWRLHWFLLWHLYTIRRKKEPARKEGIMLRKAESHSLKIQ